jgi:hypothetical protein
MKPILLDLQIHVLSVDEIIYIGSDTKSIKLMQKQLLLRYYIFVEIVVATP